jgi:hypothetical protein
MMKKLFCRIIVIKEKRKLFSLTGLFKLNFRGKFGLRRDRNEDISPDNKVDYALANAEEWPLNVDGYYNYTKFNDEGFYN